MQVTFEMNVPKENMQDKSLTAMLRIVAEVVHVGQPNELVFFRSVGGNGTVVLWNLVGSSELYVSATLLASHHANEKLKGQLSKPPFLSGVKHVVQIAEEALS